MQSKLTEQTEYGQWTDFLQYVEGFVGNEKNGTHNGVVDTGCV